MLGFVCVHHLKKQLLLFLLLNMLHYVRGFLASFNKHLDKYIMVERDLVKSILILSDKAKTPRWVDSPSKII